MQISQVNEETERKVLEDFIIFKESSKEVTTIATKFLFKEKKRNKDISFLDAKERQKFSSFKVEEEE